MLRSTAFRRGAIGVLVLGLLLEAVSRAEIVNPAFLPPFSTILVESVAVFGRADFREGLLATVLAWALGLSIAAAVAIPLGMILGLSEFSYRASRAVVELIRPIPAVALIPLVLLTLGQGLPTQLTLVVYAAVWPILFNTIYGVHDTDPKAKEMARSFGMGSLEVVRRAVIPSATPFIVTGIRIASSIALIVVITVELIAGSTAGLGAFIAQSRATGVDVELVYAGTVIAGVLGLVINSAMGAAERRFCGWESAGAER